MDYSLEHDAPQGSPEWFQARCGKITASQFKIPMRGREPTKVKYGREINRELFKGPGPDIQTESMRWGHENEPEARAKLQLHLPITSTIREAGFFIHPVYWFAGCSPDGVVEAENAIAEIKCPHSRQGHIENIKEEIPTRYRWQIQGQLWVTKATYCYFISYDPRALPGHRFHWKKVYPSESMQAQLEITIPAFWNRYVLGKEAEPITVPTFF